MVRGAEVMLAALMLCARIDARDVALEADQRRRASACSYCAGGAVLPRMTKRGGSTWLTGGPASP
jgi:hypothetical protein